MSRSLKLVGAALLTALLAQILFGQEVRVIENTPLKVYLYVQPADSPIVDKFKEKLADKLKDRGEVKILKEAKGFDYVISILADTVPDLKEQLSTAVTLPDDVIVPEIFIFSMVIFERNSKKTYEKHNLQASFTIDSMVDRAYVVIRKVFDNRK